MSLKLAWLLQVCISLTNEIYGEVDGVDRKPKIKKDIFFSTNTLSRSNSPQRVKLIINNSEGFASRSKSPFGRQ